MKEVVVGVGRDAQLGEEHHRGVHLRRLPRQIERAIRVVDRVGHTQMRHADNAAHEAMRVDRVEGLGW